MHVKETILTDAAPRPVTGAPYSQGVAFGDLIFVSGQIGVAPETMELVGPGVREQADQILRNVASVLAARGASLEHVLRATVYLTDMADFEAMNEVYARHVPSPAPARAAIGVAALPLGACVEIEVIAHAPR